MYSFPDNTEPIRQGDIFRWLPKTELALGDEKLPIITETEESGVREIDWFEIAKKNNPIDTIAVVRPVLGIVITQDCDASKNTYIAFAEIRPFTEVEVLYSEETKLKGIVNIITRESRKNQKWYYLAKNSRIEFDKKMGVDFQSIFEVQRAMLEKHKETIRIGRLEDTVASPHFRERIAEFFRRYPYNEWYPLDTEEITNYEETRHIKVDPRYPWQ